MDEWVAFSDRDPEMGQVIQMFLCLDRLGLTEIPH